MLVGVLYIFTCFCFVTHGFRCQTRISRSLHCTNSLTPIGLGIRTIFIIIILSSSYLLPQLGGAGCLPQQRHGATFPGHKHYHYIIILSSIFLHN